MVWLAGGAYRMLSLAAVQWEHCFECGERNEMGEHSTGRKEIKAEVLTPIIMKKKISCKTPVLFVPPPILMVLSNV